MNHAMNNVNPIPLRLFRALNIQGWTICSTETTSSSEIATDLKFGMLVHNKRAKFWEKCFDDVTIFLNDAIRFAKFGPKSSCPYLLKDTPL